ncbi:hypothetical protein JW824_14050 [bacterium]|nr:hypothetical protein [bacterium]
MFDKNIFITCTEMLSQLPPIKHVKKNKSLDAKTMGFDVLLDIVTDRGNIQFAVEIKGILKRPLPHHLAMMKNKLNLPLMLMSEYINPSIAKELKQNGIHYIDCQGNTYINVNKYIYLDVQGLRKEHPTEKKMSTLFQPTGLKLLFILLAYPEKLNTPLRTLQSLSSISYGQTQAAMKELEQKDFILKNKTGQQTFRDKKTLFEKWLGHYDDRLRPKLVLGSYKIAPSIEKEITRQLNKIQKQKQDGFAMGGGLGADLLIHHYRGPTTEIFVKPDLFNNVKTILKLMAAKETNITLFNLFSPWIIYRDSTTFPVVHPLFIYSELLHQGGNRARETAEMIYNAYLRKVIDEA